MEETVQILKYDFIIFQGQDLFPLLSTVIKVNGIRFGIIFAFQTTFQRCLHCSAKGKPSAHLFTALNTCSFTQSTILCCTLTVCQALGLTRSMHWRAKQAQPCPHALKSPVVKSGVKPRFTPRVYDQIEPPYDLAILLLGIYLKKMKTLIQKDMCTSMFIAALFTIAKIWRQPKCPSTDEWIKKMWYIYTMEY